LDFEKKEDAIRNARERLAISMNADKLRGAFDKQINQLRQHGLLDEQNNKIGEKVMIEKEVSDDDTEL
jgi:ABC-type amino acid transport substrate-binding protein